MAKDDYAATVAAKLIEQLKAGTAPWQKPWRPGERQPPMNPTTGNNYRGMNSIWLESQGRSDPRWMTYKQAAAVGAQVRKGEKGTLVEYWKFRDELPVTDAQGKPVRDDQGNPKTISVELERPRVFRAVVFNAEQIDGLPPRELPTLAPEQERHDRAEAILSASGANIRHLEGNRAYYQPVTDQITMPERHQFNEMTAYYAVAMHELGHWTGHPTRLDRNLSDPFGSEGYAKEELRAEIASLMVGDRIGLGHDPGIHAAYVGSWIKALQDDPREIFRAASDAEKIAKFVFDLERDRELEQQQETGAALSPVERDAGYRTSDQAGSDRVAAPARSPVLSEPPEAVMADRTYLAVPYKEKDEARALGARWDKDAKAWYAPAGVDLAAGLNRWLSKPGDVIASQSSEKPEVEFGRALRDAGLILPADPVMDGKWHRVPVAGDIGAEKSGAYKGHVDGLKPAGFYQNHKSGENSNWKASGSVDSVSPEQRAALAAEAAIRQQQRQQEREEQHERAAGTAAALFSIAPAADASNAYLQKKGIEAAPGLRTVPEPGGELPPGVVIAGDFREAKQLREDIAAAGTDTKVFVAGDLLVPAFDFDGNLWSLQSVNPGFKSFMTDGRKSGLHTIAGAEGSVRSSVLDRDASLPLIVCEGYATGDSLAKALGHPVIVAFDSGNLQVVAEGLRENYPGRDIIIAGDNDHAKEGQRDARGRLMENVGAKKAREAAEAVRGVVLLPQFEPGTKGSDWNDVHQAKGIDSMRAVLSVELTIAMASLDIADRVAAKGDQREELDKAADPKEQATVKATAAKPKRAKQADTVEDLRNAEKKQRAIDPDSKATMLAKEARKAAEFEAGKPKKRKREAEAER